MPLRKWDGLRECLTKSDPRMPFGGVKKSRHIVMVAFVNHSEGKHRAGHAHEDAAPHYLFLGNAILDTELDGKRENRVMHARETYLSKPNEFHIIAALDDCVFVEEGGHRAIADHPEWRKSSLDRLFV